MTNKETLPEPGETEALLPFASGVPYTHPGETLETVIAAARLADPVIHLPSGSGDVVFVPKGFELQDLHNPYHLPPRILQSVDVIDRASLETYAKRFSQRGQSMIMADYKSGKITARLDYHRSDDTADGAHAAAHDAHAVTLTMTPSEEFARWNGIAGKMLPQEEFARFLEENVGDVVDPDHAPLLEIARDLEASSGMQIKASTRLDNGDRTFHVSHESRVVNDNLVVPQKIRLSIPLYFGEEETDLVAHFRWRVAGGGLTLGVEWHRLEYVRQAQFRAVATAAAEETGLPLIFGTIAQ